MKTTTLKLMSFTALGVAALAGQSARADMIFDLNVGNSGITDPQPYIQVDVNLVNSTTATITFTSLTTGGEINLMGGQGAAGVNVNATSWTISGITGSNGGTGFSAPTLTDAGAGNEDGFGSFNQTINGFDGFTHSVDTLSFTLTDTSGSWTSAANVLAGNASGDLAAAHDFYTAAPADANAANSTGYVTGDGTSISLPDGGSTMIMLGTALIGLAKGRSWLARA